MHSLAIFFGFLIFAWGSQGLILLCHNLPIVAAALAAGAPRQLACKDPGNGDADCGDGGLRMAFRPDRKIRGAGNLRVAEIA